MSAENASGKGEVATPLEEKPLVELAVSSAAKESLTESAPSEAKVDGPQQAEPESESEGAIRENPPMSVPKTIKERKLRPEFLPHAFVVMPFGIKKGFDGTVINFNAIYEDLIKPALRMAGFEPFRADEETTTGDILTDMFQELLLADLVIADLSIDNANVFYELGICHALKKRGIVHIQSGRAYMPFDIFNVRTIPYHTTEDGVPDPEFLEKDIQTIARFTRDTWASGADAIHSPVFNLLRGLEEPDQKRLRTPLATGFWREYNEWKQRVAIARRQQRIGDILLLTEEISNSLIKEEALGAAGKALANMGRHELALQQYRKGLEINEDNLEFHRQEAFHLNRLGRVDEAIVKLENLLEDHPNDAESIAYLGRVYKETWINSWRWVKDAEKRLQTAFESYHWVIKAFDTYLKGYRADLNQFYPGVNAVTLGSLLVSLADRFDDAEDPDPDIVAIREILPELRGALTFALETFAEDEKADYWTLVSLAELRVLSAKKPIEVARAYRKALIASRRNSFFLTSSLGQLEMLQLLEIRPAFVSAGIEAINGELARLAQKEETPEEDGEGEKEITAEQVFIFEGYAVDPPESSRNLFSEEQEDEVRAAIAAVLDRYHADENDLAFTAGLSCGTEIIFAELCAERGMKVKLHLPLADAAYVREFVSPCGDQWVERFYKIRNHPLVDEKYQAECVGLPKEGDNLYERNNRWALYSSLLLGIDKVRLIAFWNGKSTIHDDQDIRLVKYMVDLMRDTGGIIEQINPEKLLKLEGHGVLVKDKANPAVAPVAAEEKASEKKTDTRSKKK